MMWLFLVFVAVPIIEIALFIQVGGAIGLWTTLGIVILTALIGTYLVRIQGLNTLAKLQTNIDTGRNPVGPVAHGALILVAGMLLLAPGFLTDAVGLLVLLPPVRDKLILWGLARLTVHATGSWHPGPDTAESAAEETIEAEYEIIEDAESPSNGRSGWTRRPR